MPRSDLWRTTLEAGEIVSIDDLVITRTTVTTTPAGDTLNGGLGDDTYSFALGDGNDVINEGVSATSGGAADRISILAPTTGIRPGDGLPVMTLTALNANDSNTGTTTGDLVINYGLSAGTLADHNGGGTLHRRQSPRPASSGSTSTVPPTRATCSAPTTT